MTEEGEDVPLYSFPKNDFYLILWWIRALFLTVSSVKSFLNFISTMISAILPRFNLFIETCSLLVIHISTTSFLLDITTLLLSYFRLSLVPTGRYPLDLSVNNVGGSEILTGVADVAPVAVTRAPMPQK